MLPIKSFSQAADWKAAATTGMCMCVTLNAPLQQSKDFLFQTRASNVSERNQNGYTATA